MTILVPLLYIFILYMHQVMIELWISSLFVTYFCGSYIQLHFPFKVFTLVMSLVCARILSYHLSVLFVLPLTVILFLWFLWVYYRVSPLSLSFNWLIHLDCCALVLSLFLSYFHWFIILFINYIFSFIHYIYHSIYVRSILLFFYHLYHRVSMRSWP